MISWVYLAAFIGTGLSVVLLTRIAIVGRDTTRPGSLSEVAARTKNLLWQFRATLLTCGTLFSISVFGYLVPKTHQPIILFVVWLITYIGEIALALFPASGSTVIIHNIAAYTMGCAMIIVPFLLAPSLSGNAATLEFMIGVIMIPLIPLANIQRHRFVHYELPFIYLSHISILVAMLALR